MPCEEEEEKKHNWDKLCYNISPKIDKIEVTTIHYFHVGGK